MFTCRVTSRGVQQLMVRPGEEVQLPGAQGQPYMPGGQRRHGLRRVGEVDGLGARPQEDHKDQGKLKAQHSLNKISLTKLYRTKTDFELHTLQP